MRRYLVAAGFIVAADLAASSAPHVAEVVDAIKARLPARSQEVRSAAIQPVTPQKQTPQPRQPATRDTTAPPETPDLSFDPKAIDPLPSPPFSTEDRACLARAVYFEARGEPVEGQIAVAQVVLNRVASGRWENSICGVVYQGVERGEKCQFSFACTDKRRSLDGMPGWEQAKWIADDVAAGRAQLSELEGVTHYHTHAVRPVWRLTMRPVRTIGAHVFYIDRSASGAKTNDGAATTTLTGTAAPRAFLRPAPLEKSQVRKAKSRPRPEQRNRGNFADDAVARMRDSTN